MDPYTGRVLALAGGFSYDESQFNRATQALRQPGSSFKPFIYAAALDNGYTPSSVVLDAPIEIDQGAGRRHLAAGELRQEVLRPADAALRHREVAQRHDGAARPGHGHAADLRIRPPLRRRWTTCRGCSRWRSAPARPRCCSMTAAYAMFANGGKRVIADADRPRAGPHGKTIYRHDDRAMRRLRRRPPGRSQDEPKLVDSREQVLDPMTAYQITSMMEGVVLRGTATSLQSARQADRRQDRHHQRLQGRLVRRLLARPRGRRLSRLRQAALDGRRRDRRRGRGADLRRLHEGRARRQAGDAVPRAARHQADPHQPVDAACAPPAAR